MDTLAFASWTIFILIYCLNFVVAAPSESRADHAKILRQNLSQNKEKNSCEELVDVTSSGGTISSPEYPNDYPSNLNCTWILLAPENSIVNVVISDMELEDSTGCQYDYLDVFDGPTSDNPSLGKVCGRRNGLVFPSTSNSVLINFVSDENYEAKGFLIYFTMTPSGNAGCNKTLTNSSGSVTSPLYPDLYPSNSDCYTLIKPTETGPILLEFELLALEYDEKCAFDYLEILDVSSRDPVLLGRYCTEPVNNIVTSSNQILVHFHSDQLLNSRGFDLTYSVLNSTAPTTSPQILDCTWEAGVLNGTISSPNYPDIYNSNSHCIINLQAPIDHRLRLSLIHVSLEQDEDCAFDRLEIRDGPSREYPLMRRICGTISKPFSIESTSNSMFIEFLSDDFAEFEGFLARYEVILKHNIQSTDEELETAGQENELDDYFFNLEETTEPMGMIHVPMNSTVERGHSHIMHCQSNDSTAIIAWFQGSRYVGSGAEAGITGLSLLANNSLLIREMSSQMEGTYTCVVLGLRQVLSFTAFTHLKDNSQSNSHSPKCGIALQHMEEDVDIQEGEHAFLQCHALNAEVHWLKDGVPLLPDERVEKLSNGYLVINRVSPADGGEYTCVASSEELGCEVSHTVSMTVDIRIEIEEVCGRPTAAQPTQFKPSVRKGKIIGGNDASLGSSPWQVMLWETAEGMFCSGSLIDTYWVVTAAHCFTNFQHIYRRRLLLDNLLIKLGKVDRTKPEDSEMAKRVEDVIIHRRFNEDTLDNDIALVKLASRVEFSPYVLPICLGHQAFGRKEVYEEGTLMGTVTGWGNLFEVGANPRRLQEVRIPIVRNETCRSSSQHVITDNMFCAGYEKEIIGDACKGDSGGPFSVKHEDKWYLVGIVSWGDGCGRPGKYGFYTKVNNYNHWIRAVVK